MMETELGFIRERHQVGAEIFNSLGRTAPPSESSDRFGNDSHDEAPFPMSKRLPRRMALCLAAAFFGWVRATCFFCQWEASSPALEEELLVKEIIIRGVLLLQSGVSPSIMEVNLKAYLEPAKRALIQKAA